MDVKKGDILVFAGRKDGENLEEHFRYFQVGKRYEVSRVMNVQYDIDEVTSMGGLCVLFEGESHGCHYERLEDYFVHQADWRDNLLMKILPKSIANLIKKR